MIEFIIMLLAILACSVLIILIFAPSLFELIFNYPLLWVLAIRITHDIKKKKLFSPYLKASGITALLFFLALIVLKLPYKSIIWWQTLYTIVLYIIAQLISYMKNNKKESSF
jgi:uncharacterized membrane protein